MSKWAATCDAGATTGVHLTSLQLIFISHTPSWPMEPNASLSLSVCMFVWPPYERPRDEQEFGGEFANELVTVKRAKSSMLPCQLGASAAASLWRRRRRRSPDEPGIFARR